MITQQIIMDGFRDLCGGGEVVSLPALYRWLGDNAGLTEWEKGKSNHGNYPRYQDSVRGYIANLWQADKIEHVGKPRSGKYRLIRTNPP